MTKDRDYYRRRIEEESAAARSTPCDRAREVHLDLAERYSAKVRLIESLSHGAPSAGPQPLSAPPRPMESRDASLH